MKNLNHKCMNSISKYGIVKHSEKISMYQITYIVLVDFLSKLVNFMLLRK